MPSVDEDREERQKAAAKPLNGFHVMQFYSNAASKAMNDFKMQN